MNTILYTIKRILADCYVICDGISDISNHDLLLHDLDVGEQGKQGLFQKLKEIFSINFEDNITDIRVIELAELIDSRRKCV